MHAEALTEVIKVDNDKPDKNVLERAAGIINRGGLVAFPTETVYGIAADYLNRKTIQRLHKVKERPEGKPFTIHIADFDVIRQLSCKVPLAAERLMDKFWPGPLTILLADEYGNKIGFRMPRNRLALELISACKNPIVAPSANISGNRPPCSAEEVLKDLNGRIDLLLDGGKTDVGVESTVVDMSKLPYKILREGAVRKSEIDAACR